MQLRPLSLFLFALLFAGCAKEKAGEMANGVYFIPTENLEQAQEIARTGDLTCDTPDCSPSVGLLSTASPKGARQCTASLLGPDLALTNSHCIPEDLRTAGADCQERIWFTESPNPKYNSQGRRKGCSEVLFASKASGLSPDYAFIRLQKQSTRPPLSLSRAGFADDTIYKLHKVDPTPDGPKAGQLKSVDCRSVYFSSQLPDFTHSQAEVALLADCRVIPGNSGGPVLRANGALVGVNFAKFNDTEAPLSLTTNLACVAIPGFPVPPNCDTDEIEEKARQSRAAYEQEEQGRVEADLDRMIRSGADAELQSFRWDGKVGADNVVRPYPACVQASAAGRLVDRQVTIQHPQVVLLRNEDEYGRTVHRLTKGSGLGSLTLTLRPDQSGSFLATVDENGETLEFQAPLCP